jgi:hypothetical protein
MSVNRKTKSLTGISRDYILFIKKGRQGRRCKQLLDDLMENKVLGYERGSTR